MVISAIVTQSALLFVKHLSSSVSYFIGTHMVFNNSLPALLPQAHATSNDKKHAIGLPIPDVV